MDSLTMTQAVAMGIALSSVAGMRAFLPLFGVATASHFSIMEPGPGFNWLASEAAFWTLAAAVAMESVTDAVPWLDHKIDIFVAPWVKPVLAAVAAGSVLPTDPAIAMAMGAVVGAPLAVSSHGLKTKVRLGAGILSLGKLTPVVSFLGTISAALGVSLAIIAPIAAAVLLLAALAVAWMVVTLLIKIVEALVRFIKKVHHAVALRPKRAAQTHKYGDVLDAEVVSNDKL
jgi:hypothetical protein